MVKDKKCRVSCGIFFGKGLLGYFTLARGFGTMIISVCLPSM